jgi:hypothetical protein
VTFEEFSATGALNTLGRLCVGGKNHLQWLTDIGFPTEKIPVFTDGVTFWTAVGMVIADGGAQGGLEELIDRALADYPRNPVLVPIAAKLRAGRQAMRPAPVAPPVADPPPPNPAAKPVLAATGDGPPANEKPEPTARYLARRGFVDELARGIRTQRDARQILTRAGLVAPVPDGIDRDPHAYWADIVQRIEFGRYADMTLRDLVVAACAFAPGNALFAELAELFRANQQPGFRVLFLSAGVLAESGLRADEEFRAIEIAVAASLARDGVAVKPAFAVRSGDLSQLVAGFNPHLVHVAGHGDPLEHLYFADGPVEGDRFAELIRALGERRGAALRAVLLNACWSNGVAKLLTEHSLPNGATLAACGWVAKVQDNSAIEFSRAFYGVLASSYDHRSPCLHEAANIAIAQTTVQGNQLPKLQWWGPEA